MVGARGGESGGGIDFGGQFGQTPFVSLPFFGMCAYQGWIAVVCDGRLTGGTGWEFAFGGMDIPLFASLFLCALYARYLGSFWRHGWIRTLSVLLLVGASLFGYAFLATDHPSPLLGVVFNLLAGVGMALTTLLWFEAYSAISPVRTLLCFAVTHGVAGLIGWLYRGFQPEWLPVASALLPVIALRCLWNCHRGEGAAASAPVPWVEFTFPWKPVLVDALYAFAYGLLYPVLYTVSSRTSAPSGMAFGLIVALLVIVLRDRIDFGVVFSRGFPPFIAAMFVLGCAVVDQSAEAAHVFANIAYSAYSLFILTSLCSLCHRWGVSPVSLFSIEQIAQLGAILVGRGVAAVCAHAMFPVAPLLVASVTVATIVAMREQRISSSWGMRVIEEQSDSAAAQEARERAGLAVACARVASVHGLSRREEEALFILARRGTAGSIERELGVSNGTAKAYVQRVYRKLAIHSREELFGLVEKARQESETVASR